MKIPVMAIGMAPGVNSNVRDAELLSLEMVPETVPEILVSPLTVSMFPEREYPASVSVTVIPSALRASVIDPIAVTSSRAMSTVLSEASVMVQLMLKEPCDELITDMENVPSYVPATAAAVFAAGSSLLSFLPQAPGIVASAAAAARMEKNFFMSLVFVS